jgi:alpha-tubulin suppressor-like RCC1 family protein
MKYFFLIAVLAVSFLACQQTPQPPAAPSLGTLELRLDNSGNSKAHVARVRVSSGGQTRGALREADVTFTALNSTATQNDGAFDYLQAQFTVQNTSGTAFQNLTLYAVAKNGNIANTAIKSITNFGGLTSTDEQTRIAKLITATHALNISSVGLSLIPERADMQLFTPTEVTALQNDPALTTNGFSSNDKVLGYGFVARRCVPNCVSPTSFVRDIAAGQSGLITIALRIPRSTGTAYNFVMTFAVVDEPNTRVTRSVYPPETLASAENRLSAFGATSSGEIMQLGLDRTAKPSASFANKGADVVNVSSDTVNGNASYNALGLERYTSGDSHTCALTASGQAYCWGDNSLGQLGNGSNTNTSVPTLVGGGLVFSSITAGTAHTCGLTTAGTVHCWGNKSKGQTGTGSSGGSLNLPTIINLGVNFSSISAGGNSTCGIVLSGAGYCWGDNSNQKLGITNTNLIVDTAQPVLGGLSFSSISVGGEHICALTLSGAAYCWGNGRQGQLGNSMIEASQPTAVTSNLSFSSINAGGQHTCALSSGVAYCWGFNSRGQLGDGSNNLSVLPTIVLGNLSFSSLETNYDHSCAITLSGTLYCWGGNNSGQLGDNSATNRSVPSLVAGNLVFSSVFLGNQHTCAITTSGISYCWGSNSSGQLGNNAFNTATAPTAVSGFSFSSISAGAGSTCGLTASGKAYCWGDNSIGQLGSTGGGGFTPVAVEGNLTFAKISTWFQHTCGITTTSEAYCWGSNTDGQLGRVDISVRSVVPVAVNTSLRFSSITLGDFFTCGLTTGFTAYCWGSNAAGQLGNNSTANSSTPVAVVDQNNLMPNFSSISANSRFACGLDFSSSVYCWGSNNQGQLGTSSTITESKVARPVLIQVNSQPANFRASSISTGGNFTCSLSSALNLGAASYCWGRNQVGQLGIGTNIATFTPTAGADSINFSSISAGTFHTCGLNTFGTAVCWGQNDKGQLGDNTNISSNRLKIVAFNGFFSSISSGQFHTCALTASGTAYCWGDNQFGQLSISSFARFLVPTRDNTVSFKL